MGARLLDVRSRRAPRLCLIPITAHLTASPPVRSPARWGSMAGSPLLCGPRAGGVGILVLLLLGILRLPPTLSARPVKVRPQLAGGGGRVERKMEESVNEVFRRYAQSFARVAWAAADSPRAGQEQFHGVRLMLLRALLADGPCPSLSIRGLV